MHAILNRPSRVLQIAAAMFSSVAGTLRVPSASLTRTAHSSRASVTARGACLLLCLALVAFAASARADIFQWEYIDPADPSQGKQQSTTLAPDGAGVDAVPGANLSVRNLTMAYLIRADLTSASGFQSILTNADLSHANLTNADFTGAWLSGADFTNADVCGALFHKYVYTGVAGTGLTLAQIYSTASYQAYDLSGIGLTGSDLAGGNFTGQKLTNANFRSAGRGAITDLTGADFTAADARGAVLFDFQLSGATTANLIRFDGHLDGLDLDADGLLAVRDHDGNPRDEYGIPVLPVPIPITIDEHLAMGPGGTLRMVFEADDWNSTISFAAGIPVALGGTLELAFAADVNLASQLGRTFDLFDWTGVDPTGAFAVSSPYAWDLSNLYTTGQVTLTAIPEPTTLVTLLLGVLLVLAPRRALVL